MKPHVVFRLVLASGALLSAAAACAQAPIGDVVATDGTVRGSLVLASSGPKLASGSAVTAGTATAVVRLDRGGQVRICPGTTVTMTSMGGASSLMMSLGDGAMETRYSIPALADAIMTPDFRLLLAGPAQFDLALASNSKGDLCVESRSDSASVLVNELLGDGVYQVRARDSVIFHGGRVAGAQPNPAGCGCPAPPRTLLRAQVAPTPSTAFSAPLPAVPVLALPQPLIPAPATALSADLVRLPQAAGEQVLLPAPEALHAPIANLPQPPSEALIMPAPANVSASLASLPKVADDPLTMPAPNAPVPVATPPQPPADSALTAPPPPLAPNDVHVEVEAPFVFSANAAPPPVTPGRIVLGTMAAPALPLLQVSAPPAVPPKVEQVDAKPQKKKGLLGRLGGFFASLFSKR